jgi:hypothetical protein
MTKIVEFEPPPKEEPKEKYLKPIEVLNIPIIIESYSIEKRPGRKGDYDNLILVTDKGKIQTGAKVLVKQILAKKDVFENGNKLRAIIKTKTSPAGTYYYFEKP